MPAPRGKDNRPKSLIISRTVAVPRPDDDLFANFFSSSLLTTSTSVVASAATPSVPVLDAAEFSLEAFDQIISQSNELYVLIA